MEGYTTRQFTALALLSVVLPGAFVYGAWANVAHEWPFCGDNHTGYVSNYDPVLMSVENLTHASSLILVGNVSTVGPTHEIAPGDVFTDVVVNASQYLKTTGPSRPQVQLGSPGGTVGCYTVFVSGMPTFNRGESVLLFLSPDSHLGYNVVGGDQGKYVITGETAYSLTPMNTVVLKDLIAEIKGSL